MSFRRKAVGSLRFDPRLFGAGVQMHNDMAFCLAVKRSGWKLIYDPAVLVDHYEAPRFCADGRGVFSAEAVRNQVHNETLTLLEYLSGPGRLFYLLIMFLIGTQAEPGLLQSARLAARCAPYVGPRWRATQDGRFAGIRSFFRSSMDRNAT
jgi:hypothetical protein